MSRIANGKARPQFALLHFSTGQTGEVAPALNLLSVRMLTATATSPDNKKKGGHVAFNEMWWAA